ncbi:MAG: hypothetical protein ACK4ND_18785, partial [Cytophagaceae bacterium]
SVEFDVHPVASIGLPIEVLAIPVQTNVDESFAQEGVSRENVEDVKLEALKLVMLNPPDHTFDFVKSIDISISVSDNSLPEKLLAFHHDIPRGEIIIDLKTTGEKMDEYIKRDRFLINVKCQSRETFTKELKIKADMIFNVRAVIFK